MAARLSPIERYWSKVEKGPGCWIWRGERLAAGYGKIKIEGRYWLAHRYAIVMRDGAVEDEAFVCHHCDNTSCVRPDHLYVGDAASNARDMSVRGRTKGHLRSADAEEIWQAHAAGATARELGLRFKVSPDVIYGVLNLRTYRHGEPIEF